MSIHTDVLDGFPQADVFTKEFNGLLSRLEMYRKGLIARSPYKIGDKVFLLETPKISEESSSGWLRAKHFLIRGAVAVVNDFDYYEGAFGYGLHFEKESTISNGVVTPVKKKNQYWFRETVLGPVGV